MADSKLTDLSAITALTGDDLLYAVDDPGGTPASKKITAANAAIGLSTLAHYGGALTLTDPTTQSWTSLGSPTITTTGRFINCFHANNGAAWPTAAQHMAEPSTPYTITAGFFVNADRTTGGTFLGGVGWRESGTNRLIFAAPVFSSTGNATYWTLYKLTDTGNSATYDLMQSEAIAGGGPHWIQLRNDGTNLSVWASSDGIHFHQQGSSRAKNNYFTTGPDQVYFGVVPFNTDASITLFHWKIG